MGIWRDGVIPVTVKRRAFDVDGRHLLIGDDDATGVLGGIEFAAHRQAGLGGGRRD